MRGEVITQLPEREVVLLGSSPALTVTWSRYATGLRGPDPHVHREHTDAFYVLEGQLSFDVGPGPERIRVPAGGFVAVPPGVVHTFLNDSGAEARWLNFHAPDMGFAEYLRTGSPWDSFEA